MYLEEGRSSYEIIKSLELDAKMIRRWVEAFKEHGITKLAEQRETATGSRKGRPKTQGLTLEQEVQRLRMENEFLKKL